MRMSTASPESQARLVYGDLDQPGSEFRFSPKARQALQRLQESLLCHVFSLGHIVQYGICSGEDGPFKWPDELVKQFGLAPAYLADQFLLREALGDIPRHHSMPSREARTMIGSMIGGFWDLQAPTQTSRRSLRTTRPWKLRNPLKT